jgi:hypothetical protein
MDDFDNFDEDDEVEEVAEVEVPDLAEEEPYAPGVGVLQEYDAEADVAAPGPSDVSQAWQDNKFENTMSDHGLEASLQDLNIEYNPADIAGIMRRYEEQNGSYSLTEAQFYEVVDELKGAVGGGKKRKVRKTRRGGKSKKVRKTRKGKKVRKTRKGRKGKKSRKTRK